MSEEIETIYGRMTMEEFEIEYRKRHEKRKKDYAANKGITVVDGGG